MTVLSAMVAVLVFGPVLLLAPVILTLCVVGLFATDSPSRVRRRFECPVRHQAVTADFAVPVGAGEASTVLACSAFREPSRVTCAQRCLEATTVRWAPPVGVFAGWALTAGGVVGPDSTPSRPA